VPAAGRRRRKGTERVEPLGSLSLGGSDLVGGTEKCSVCGGTSLTRVRMVLTDGTPAVFVSCHDCEHRGWHEIGGDGVEKGIDWVTEHSVKDA
jgi:hypothetical protein